MKKTTIMLLLILTASLLVLSGCKSNPIIGGDKDENGCLIAAGYSWCEAKQKCLRVWEENCTSESTCACPEGYVQDGEACNPECYYSKPQCMAPSIKCSAPSNDNTPKACTEEAKICPDGSAVGRVGPNCEFAACPGEPECGACPQFAPASPDFCKDGVAVGGLKDRCGCVGHPTCLEKNYCKPEQRNAQACTMEYRPVCGWSDSSIKCFAYPCAQTYSNPCGACIPENVEYWTEGECPAVNAQ